MFCFNSDSAIAEYVLLMGLDRFMERLKEVNSDVCNSDME